MSFSKSLVGYNVCYTNLKDNKVRLRRGIGPVRNEEMQSLNCWKNYLPVILRKHMSNGQPKGPSSHTLFSTFTSQSLQFRRATFFQVTLGTLVNTTTCLSLIFFFIQNKTHVSSDLATVVNRLLEETDLGFAPPQI